MEQKLSFPKLTVTINERNDSVVYIFVGEVDEQFSQKQLPRPSKAKVFFDLGGISSVNSCGIREWIQMIEDFASKSSLYYQKCSVTMVDQINMVPDCQGNAVIESVYAPYFCSKDGEMNMLIDFAQHKKNLQNKIAPEMHCTICKQKLEFDALEESYFLFVNGSSISQAS